MGLACLPSSLVPDDPEPLLAPLQEAERFDPAPDVAHAAIGDVDVRRGWRERVRSIAIDVSPLRRHREFRLLWFGQCVTFLGSMVTYVAIPFQVYDLTESPALVGLLGGVELVAILSLAFVGGAFADAVDRRRMVQVTEGTLALMSGVLLVNALVLEQLWLLYVCAFVMAGVDALQRPSLDALLPRLVDKDELAAAGALTTLRGTVGMLGGPALAGGLIAVFGLPTAYGFDIVTFLVSLSVLARMKAVPPPPGAERPSLARVLEGLRYARSRQELLGTYAVDIVAMFFGMPMALFPAIAAGLGGPKVLGLLYAAPAAGALIATVTSGWTGRVHRHGLGVIAAATVWGLAVLGFGLANSLPLALLFLALAGGADMVSGIFRMVIWNRTPDQLRGRLASIELISYSSGPALGNVEAGLVASVASVRTSVVSGGVLCVVGVAITALLLPKFVRYDGRVTPEVQ